MKINWKRLTKFAAGFIKALLLVTVFTFGLCFLFDIDFHWKLPIMNTVVFVLAAAFID